MLGLEILAHLYFFLSRVFARLEMRHTRDFGVGISNYAYWSFKNAKFGPFLILHTCISLVEFSRFGQCLG